MLDHARARIATAGLEERVTLRVGYADDLPAGDRFDGATLLLVLHFLPDDGSKLTLLRAIAARLQPGAPLVLADLHGEPGTPAFEALFAAWRESLLLTGAEPDVVEAGIQAARGAIHFVSEPRLAALLAEAGFTPPLRFWDALLYAGWICERRTSRR